MQVLRTEYLGDQLIDICSFEGDDGADNEEDEEEGLNMGEVVNLDALVLREDFLTEAGAAAGVSGKVEASKTDLLKGENFRLTLRKPDFQRETAAWSPEQICEFLKSFIGGELIPAVICWQSASRLTFVIDGAHRLSAVIAWLEDDYGAGDQSIKFYNNKIPPDQRRIHERTRSLVNKEIGSYREVMAEAANPGSNPKLSEGARSLANALIPLLWVKGTDHKKAERAFLTINQSAIKIDPTEFTILNGRTKPNAIASRAIVRNGTGHKYWKDFSANGQEVIETAGQKIYSLLYSPPLDPPIRTQDLPVAGFGYGTQTLPLVFDFVNIANGIAVVDSSKEIKKKLTISSSTEPANEEETLVVMAKAKDLAELVTGTHPSSLGLHPAVYFYSANGRHQATSVLAVAALLSDLRTDEKLHDFTSARAGFEEFLITHKSFINQLTTKHGSMAKGFRPMRDYFRFVLDFCIAGKSAAEIESLLRSSPKYQGLVQEKVILTTKAKKFSRNAKQYAIVSELLQAATTCGICHAKIDFKAMHIDHIEERAKGGLGTVQNSQPAHPYCDSTYKRRMAAAK